MGLVRTLIDCGNQYVESALPQELRELYDRDLHLRSAGAVRPLVIAIFVSTLDGVVSVHMKSFGSLDAITPGMAQVAHTPHLPQLPLGSGPRVSFARSGITAKWDPKFASLLELAEACDVPVRWSCRTGICHTCMTGLIDGSIAYNPETLERPAAGNVLVCCSRPSAGVTLDL